MVLSTHSQTHLGRTFFRVGQTPRRALWVTQSIVESGPTNDYRGEVRVRFRPAGWGRPPCGRGQETPERRLMSKTMLERESCPRAADGVKRNGGARYRGFRRSSDVCENVQNMHDSCDTNTHYPIG